MNNTHADRRQQAAGSDRRGESALTASYCRRPAFKRGFTVIELLVVIGIIVLALGLAVPAFKSLSSSNGEASAANQISAILGRARSEAIAFQELRGVFFYPDEATGRYIATLVHTPSFDSYAAGTPYTAGQYVSVAGAVTSYYCALQDTMGNTPSSSPSNLYWRKTHDDSVIDSILPNEDSVTLAANVGLQVICDSRITPGTPPTKTSDGYLRCGAIFFDGSGGLVMNHQISICSGGAIGKRMGLFNTTAVLDYPDPTSPCILNPAFPYESSCGLVMYDRDALAGQSFFSENDFWVRDPRLTDSKYTAPTAANEIGTTTGTPAVSEEDWLDKNATVFLMNRYNGLLIKGQ